MPNDKTIAKNTLFLYSRMLLTMVVGLLTAGITLNVLGVTDYGIYAVVGGFVSMFEILNSSMTSATQRFLSFDLGKNDQKQLRKTFSSSVTIHFGIGVIVVFALETFGLWYINNRLNVPVERLTAVNIIFQFSVLTSFLSIIQMPYNALITAHERFNVYAYISILELTFKILILFLIIHVEYDKLILYSGLLFISSFIIRLIYRVYSRKNFPESRYFFFFDKAYFKTLISFTGWSLFGQLSNIARMQAITLMLNQMFSPAIVAARAISTTVATQVNSFSGSFNASLYPPIIKSYSSGELEKMHQLLYRGSKFSFFLMWLLALPFLVEMPLILKLWLKNPPEGSVLFSQLAVVESLILSISMPVTAAARAPGKMRKYELTLGGFQIGIFLISWVFLHFGCPAYSVYVVAIGVNVSMFFVRLWLVKGLIDLDINTFNREAVLPALLVVLISFFPTYLLYRSLDHNLLNAVIVVVFSLLFSALVIYVLGLKKTERKLVNEFVYSKVRKLRK